MLSYYPCVWKVSSVTCRRSMVSSGYSGFLHQKTDFIIISPPWYDPGCCWGLKPQTPIIIIIIIIIIITWTMIHIYHALLYYNVKHGIVFGTNEQPKRFIDRNGSFLYLTLNLYICIISNSQVIYWYWPQSCVHSFNFASLWLKNYLCIMRFNHYPAHKSGLPCSLTVVYFREV